MMTDTEMRTLLVRYSEAFDVMLKEMDKMKARIELLEGKQGCASGNRVKNGSPKVIRMFPKGI